MQELSSTGHVFTIDKAQYMLPPLSVADIAAVQSFAALQPVDQATAMTDLLATRAAAKHGPALRWFLREKAPADAIRTLGAKQASELFTAWAAAGGITSGESVSSGS